MKLKEKISNKSFLGNGIELHPVAPCDLPALRRWRNSLEIRSQMFDFRYVGPHEQRMWFEESRENQNQFHWIVRCKGIRTGYMDLKASGDIELIDYIDGGLYVGNSSVRHGLLGYAIALMQLKIVFEYLNVPRYETSYRENNNSAKRFNEQLGYRVIGQTDDFIRIAIQPFEYEATKNKFQRYFKQ